jgi:uncharacterized protein YjiS (DUF1127 family)
MSAVNQDKTDKSAGQILKNLYGAFLGQLAVINYRLGLRKLVRRINDEARRNATLRQLNLLNDYRLDDIGIRRPSPDRFYSRLDPEVMRIDARRVF